jgi:catechol 2,3-dioxygenase-like lactoylglutathione lyase family enzyme
MNPNAHWMILLLAACAAAGPPASSSAPTLRPLWVGISVTDAEASARWYRDKLHFTVTRRMNLPEHKLRIVFLEREGFTVELVEFQDSVSWQSLRARLPELTDRDKLQGFRKLGFLVPDVDGLAADLERQGVMLRMKPVDDPPFGHRYFLVEDPSGNLLQFFQLLK